MITGCEIVTYKIFVIKKSDFAYAKTNMQISCTLITSALFSHILNKKRNAPCISSCISAKVHTFQISPGMFFFDRYQATRCSNLFLISTNRRRVSPIRLNARNHIENAKCACASSLFSTWSSSGYYHQSDTL